jgi:hypothetical protein
MSHIYQHWIFAVAIVLGSASPTWSQDRLVEIYVVRHPETDPASGDSKTIHLNETGRKRATLLAPTLAGIRVTHLFASHTVRTREALEGLAKERSLPIVQLPQPGTTWKGQVVTDEMSRREPIEPLAEALLELNPGSIAVVALNSENIYAVLNRLGVPVAQTGQSCAIGQMCVPCLNNACFPPVFDRLWYIALRPAKPEPVVFVELRYGAGW